MPIYNLDYNLDDDNQHDNNQYDDNQYDDNQCDYLEDLYYIKSNKPICTKIDVYVALFNITVTSFCFYYFLQ